MSVVKNTSSKAKVLYDGHCVFCRKSVELLRRLDWFKVLAYVDVRDPEQFESNAGIDRERVLQEMHLIAPDGGKLYHGFKALRWMAWRLPLLWAIAPLMYVPGIPTLGQKLYLWIARNRFRLIPCHGGVCTFPKSEEENKETAG